MKKKLKISMAMILTIAMVTINSLTVFAATTTATGTGTVSSSVTVNGTINPITISVTYPVSVAYNFDPNTGANGTFTAPTINVTNNSKVAINVAVSSVQAASGGSITMTDVDPLSKTWASLNNIDSKKYCAVGVLVPTTPGGWNAGYLTTTRWGYQTGNWAVGSLNSAATGNLTLNGKFGLAIDQLYTSIHNIVFSFSLV